MRQEKSKHRRLRAGLALALALPLRAQDECSTLAALLERADAVALTRAVLVDARDAAVLRVVLAVDETLAGTPPATIELVETRGPGCGRTLTAVAPGQRFLACVRQSDGGWRLCAGGARALPPASAAIVRHARALLAVGPGASRVAVLVAALGADDERVRNDAALALPLQVALERADAGERAALLAALQAAVAGDERRAPSLVTAAVRLRLVAALDVMLPVYLDGTAGACERLFQDSMVRIDPDALAARIAVRLPSLPGPLARARATTLLLEIDAPAARAPLREVLRTASERGTRVRACAGLLRSGVPVGDLADIADAELLALARRVAQPSRPTFRVIRTE